VSPWLIWLIGAGVLAVAEVFTLDLVLLMISGGALVGGIAALTGAPVWLQVVLFAVASVVLVLFARPVARRHLHANTPDQLDGAHAFVGRIGVVTQQVGEHDGRIRIGGDEWTAVAQLPDCTFAVGSTVRVVDIRGAHAVVSDDY
jgi:membrane protein implicated in regulation of membrane protease activity